GKEDQMTGDRGNTRAEMAKRNDDNDLLEVAAEASPTPAGQQGSGGGNLQRDIGSSAEQRQVNDPAGHEGVTKGKHAAHGQGTREPHPARQVVTER
ncbi:MAG TPA: hypothetical protein VFO51_08765, partial [Sphingomicrobium sp.]|nr:hypothetical protein [Sphingomicrobium sp.]